MSGRICHAVELSPVYVVHGGSLAGTGKVARLDSDGRAFAAVAAERGIPLGREAYGAAQTSLSRS